MLMIGIELLALDTNTIHFYIMYRFLLNKRKLLFKTSELNGFSK